MRCDDIQRRVFPPDPKHGVFRANPIAAELCCSLMNALSKRDNGERIAAPRAVINNSERSTRKLNPNVAGVSVERVVY